MREGRLLEVQNLKTHFHTETGRVTAVDGVTFHVDKGEILGIVGESGCGKSVTSQSILRLFDEKNLVKYEGEILFEGSKDLLKLSKAEMREARGNDISMIFQDPLSSLNPVLTIGFQIAEALMLHEKLPKDTAWEKSVEMLRLTGIPSPDKRAHDYPHQLSGGMRQRVMIAMALACQPKLLIADEPTTALDVTIQSQILDLIKEINEKFDTGVIFITHDLGVVAELCDRVAVMYLGQIVEEAHIYDLFEKPKHPYTQGLIQSIPQMDGDRNRDLHVIQGTVPSLDNVPAGCRFAPRCQFADELCHTKSPELRALGVNQNVRCWHAERIAEEGALINAGT